jgi:hypothetical protein
MIYSIDELRSWPLSYLATPYSLHPIGHEAAFTSACGITAKLMQMGVSVYSPIVHMHHVALYGDFDPVDHEFWTRINRPMIELAHGLIVAKIWGWEQSRGIEQEIRDFTDADKPIVYIDRSELY